MRTQVGKETEPIILKITKPEVQLDGIDTDQVQPTITAIRFTESYKLRSYPASSSAGSSISTVPSA